MSTFINIHTHRASQYGFSILNCFPSQLEALLANEPKQAVSAGIHPWHIDADADRQLEVLRSFSAHPQLFAIGEAGLDKLTQTPFERQSALFRQQADIAEQARKPLIIHCVKAFDEIIRLKKEIKPTQAWIIHGFRGKKQLAEQLILSDFYLSFGKNIEHLSDTIHAVPLNKIFLETDGNQLKISEVYQLFAQIKGISVEMLAEQIQWNFGEIFSSVSCQTLIN